MLKYLFIILVLYFCFQIIKNTGYKRLLWTLTGLLLLNSQIIVLETPLFSSHRCLYTALLCSIIFRFKTLKRQLPTFPLLKMFGICFLGLLCIGLFDDRFSLFSKIYQPLAYISGTFLLIIVGFLSLNSEEDFNKTIKGLIYTSIVMFLYAIFNYITKSNPYYEVVSTLFSAPSSQALSYLELVDGRLRIISTANISFNYGYYSAVLAAISLYAYLNKNTCISSKLALIGLTASLGGVVLCASRTVLFVAVIGLFVLILLGLNLKSKIKITIFVFLIFVTSYALVPIVQERTDAAIDVFLSGGEKAGGSSFELRAGQFIASYDLFLKSPVWGNGYGYNIDVLGVGTDNFSGDSDLFGAESYIFVLMIEQGLVGLIIAITIFTGLFIYFTKHRKDRKLLSALGVSIILIFLIFAIGTGTLGAWPITMILIGIIMKCIKLKSQSNFKLINPS